MKNFVRRRIDVASVGVECFQYLVEKKAMGFSNPLP